MYRKYLTIKSAFPKKLLEWNKKHNKRQMPWKGEKDPYKIWLSEIILQQTRVEQGWDYYNRFIAKYPSVLDLAAAKDADVFKLWEGLGYYSRCRNLLETARHIVNQMKGVFPQDFEKILKLRGIGPYTAAAIASFAYDLPHAVVDGNVMRVLARFFGISEPIDSTNGKKLFAALAQQLLDKKKPGIYNQAIMDFGATVCKPQQPLCLQCPLQDGCVAYAKKRVDALPVKLKKLRKKNRWFYYILAQWRNGFYIRKREQKDIWQNLYEFLLIETNDTLPEKELLKQPLLKKSLGEFDLLDISKEYKQQLTHQTIHGKFVHIKLHKKILTEGYEWKTKKEIAGLAFTGFINAYFKGMKQH
ncbi:MAG: A/G-specific adenine glycosylase [Ferruginibacter sp.]